MSVIRLAQNGLVFCNNTLFSFRVSEENISGKLNNASSLESKANATIQFYADLQDLLKGKTATNYLEKFYIEKIYAEIFRAKRKKLTNWFEDSSANAALRCLPLYIKCNCFSIRSLIRMFVRKLLTRK